MYKLLYVDDEVIMREGIQEIIDWKCNGIELVGVAEDGNEAAEIALRERPDIVITDILMPFMDGIELVKKLREIQPLVKIIILSGYDEFDYAQQAIQYKVSSYLLKPVVPDKLMEIVKGVIAEIDSDRDKKSGCQELVDFSTVFRLPLDDMNNLGSVIKLGYSEKVGQLVDEIFDQATKGFEKNQSYKAASFKFTALSIFNLGNKVICDMAIVAEPLHEKLKAYINLLDNCLSEVSIKECIKDYLLEIISTINSFRRRNDILVAQKCKEIIKNNYMECNLCLNKIAAYVHLSPGYLSRIFRQETGSSVNSYLIAFRLERVKELLKTTNGKLHEIACKVGYKDEFYLSNAFKKNTGMRPSEYRESVQL